MKSIYSLRHPKTHRVRYIGATATSLKQRLSVHISMARRNTNACAAWIRSLLAQGLRPIISDLGATADWQRFERKLIAAYRMAGGRLLNMTAGGLGCVDCRPSDATRAKRATTLKKRYAGDPQQMAARQQLARDAARSPAGRAAASARMTAIWADPKRAAEMRKRMQGAKARKAAQC